MKQVIVMRTDLNMRKGKMIAQAAHSVLGIFIDDNISKESLTEFALGNFTVIADDVVDWIAEGMKKICVGCKSEQELLNLYNSAKAANLPAFYVKDAGYTELEPDTITCLAIGPANDEDIDKITGHLKLL